MQKMSVSSVPPISRTTVWIYRALAISASVAAYSHLPMPNPQAQATKALQLAQSQTTFLARAGVRRMRTCARAGGADALRAGDGMRILGECAERGEAEGDELREAAVEMAGVLAEGVGERVAGVRGLEGVLGGEACQGACREVWRSFGVGDEVGVEERRRLLSMWKVKVDKGEGGEQHGASCQDEDVHVGFG